MNKALVGPPKEEEEPIYYWLVQGDDAVYVEAQRGDVRQTILALYGNRVRRIGFVTPHLGLPMDGIYVAVE